MITKEKNLIKIIDENQKEWIYDINLGKWIQGDVSGSTYIRFSMYADKRTDNVCRYVVLALSSRTNTNSYVQLDFETYANGWSHEFNADYIRYVDKCVSANVPCLLSLREYAPEFKTIMAHFSEYAELVANAVVDRYFRACPDLPHTYISEPLPEYGMNDRTSTIIDTWTRNRYSLDVIRKYAPHYEKQFNELDYQEKHSMYELLDGKIKNHTRYYETALYYFFKLIPYYRITCDNVAVAIEKYIERCDFLKIPPRKESNFIKLLVDIDKEYQIKKREFNKQLLVERYTPHLEKLAFEDDKYIIVVPLTEEAFAEEARVQRNCVYSAYFPSIVDEQDRNMRIVFMRKKENINTPYVTIELDLQNSGWHRIEQALQRNNEDVVSQEANEFLEKYEEHLQTYYPISRNNDDIEDTWTF